MRIPMTTSLVRTVQRLSFAVFAIGLATCAPPARAGGPEIRIALSADLSASAATAGHAIRRGAALAIEAINRDGGVLGRPLALVVHDHRGNPARGTDDMRAIVGDDEVVAALVGLHSAVALAQAAEASAAKLPLLVPWAAATGLVENGLAPNPVFRVSANDREVAEFLIDSAQARGLTRPGLLLENSAWGRSNESALRHIAAVKGVELAAVRLMPLGGAEAMAQLESILEAGADSLVLALNPTEGTELVKAMASLPAQRRRPMLSHWGLTGRNLFHTCRELLPDVDLSFLQTFSFRHPVAPGTAARAIALCRDTFDDCAEPERLAGQNGIGQAHDAVLLIAAALRIAGKPSRAAVLEALPRIEVVEGLLKRYQHPFASGHREGLSKSDYRLGRYLDDGTIRFVGKES